MAKTQLKPISCQPEDFVAGGLINDVDVEVESAEFTTEGPPNYTVDALFFKASLKTLADGQIVDQWWSCGAKAKDDFTPSDDGRFLLPTGPSGAKALVKGSNFHVFVESLVGKGFTGPGRVCGDAATYKGIQMHLVQQVLKDRPGMTQSREGRTNQVLVCERIIKLPGEKAKRAATPAAKAAPAAGAKSAPAPEPATTGTDNGDLSELAASTLQSVLAANEGTLAKKAVRAQVFRAMQASKTDERNEVLKLISDQSWLEAHDFLVDDLTVAYVPA